MSLPHMVLVMEKPLRCALWCTWQIGWLVTVANVGDSLVMMDTMGITRMLSKNRRLDEDPEEVQRLTTRAPLPFSALLLPIMVVI